jgi:ATP-binding cassette subfamily F protein 3
MRAASHVQEMERELESLSKELSQTDHEHDADELSDLLERYAHLHEKYEREGGYDLEYKLREVLDGLSFRAEDLDRPLRTFSGGQKTRASLARVLLRTPDLLLLDEPTNHLDIHAIEFLEEYLADYAGAYIIISHDRYFLSQVVNKIVYLKEKKLNEFTGTVDEYIASQQ